MFLTEKEIDEEFDSIARSVRHVLKQKSQLEETFRGKSKCIFIGCGSSYSVGKSSASLMQLRCNVVSYAIAAGDVLLHFDRYLKLLQDSVIVFLSRSGSTSEVIETAKLIKEKTSAVCISICAKDKSELDDFCSMNICIPWAFDRSVCQTRTVGSLYACVVAMVAVVCGSEQLIEELLALTENANNYKDELLPTIKRVVMRDWNHVVILADCETAGLMEEGSLAFKEICQINSNFYNVLDVRHGPMVMINERTFVFILLDNLGKITTDLILDIKAKGALCVACGPFKTDTVADESVNALYKDPAVYGIFALYFLQITALYKALNLGINPDKPTGLSPWIKL